MIDAGNKRMQAFSEMQVDANIDSTPRPYSSGAASSLCYYVRTFETLVL